MFEILNYDELFFCFIEILSILYNILGENRIIIINYLIFFKNIVFYVCYIYMYFVYDILV